MKNHLITLITLNIIITMTGCGGSSEEEKNSPKEIVEITPPPLNLAKEISSTSDLISNDDFNFISSADLDITIPASPSTAISYFINICSNFSTENNEIKINYDSCKLRSTLAPQEQSFTLSLSTEELRLIAQIWPVEHDAQPITIYWNIAEFGNSWKIAI
ncbi:MAG: hypothetical protein RPS47_11105 [Colwellia sp.]